MKVWQLYNIDAPCVKSIINKSDTSKIKVYMISSKMKYGKDNLFIDITKYVSYNIFNENYSRSMIARIDCNGIVKKLLNTYGVANDCILYHFYFVCDGYVIYEFSNYVENNRLIEIKFLLNSPNYLLLYKENEKIFKHAITAPALVFKDRKNNKPVNFEYDMSCMGKFVKNDPDNVYYMIINNKDDEEKFNADDNFHIYIFNINTNNEDHKTIRVELEVFGHASNMNYCRLIFNNTYCMYYVMDQMNLDRVVYCGEEYTVEEVSVEIKNDQTK